MMWPIHPYGPVVVLSEDRLSIQNMHSGDPAGCRPAGYRDMSGFERNRLITGGSFFALRAAHSCFICCEQRSVLTVGIELLV